MCLVVAFAGGKCLDVDLKVRRGCRAPKGVGWEVRKTTSGESCSQSVIIMDAIERMSGQAAGVEAPLSGGRGRARSEGTSFNPTLVDITPNGAWESCLMHEYGVQASSRRPSRTVLRVACRAWRTRRRAWSASGRGTRMTMR